MEGGQFTDLLLVAAVAFTAPLLLGLAPRFRLPAVVLEIVAGIVIGPAVLGWAEPSEAVEVLSVLGLAFLLFLAGLEIEFHRLRGQVLRLAALGFAVSFAIALALSVGLSAGGLFDEPLLVAIILTATSLGVIIPVLKDAGEAGTTFGQLVIAAASIADFATILLLTLFFSRESAGAGSQAVLLGGFAVAGVAVFLALRRAERSTRLSEDLLQLQDTTAQIRVRGAFVLLVGFAALAGELGLEVILGAFAAGAILTLLDRDEMMTHPAFRTKLEAAGFGIFIPVFFVTSGLRFDLDALFSEATTIAQIPVFLVALLAVRGLPALLYRNALGTRQAGVAGLLQATSLPFIVAGTQIGMDLGVLERDTGAALVAAGLASVIVFPAVASSLISGRTGSASATTAAGSPSA